LIPIIIDILVNPNNKFYIFKKCRVILEPRPDLGCPEPPDWGGPQLF